MSSLTILPVRSTSSPADPVANDAVFSPVPDRTLIRFRDLRVAPSPLALALVGCAVPTLMLGSAAQSLPALAAGAGMLAAVAVSFGLAVGTLRHLRLACAPPSPCFSGDIAVLVLSIEETRGRARRDIAVTPEDVEAPGVAGWTDVAAFATASVAMPLPATGRGPRPLPAVRLQTCHPFALVRVRVSWTPRRTWRVLARPAPFLG